MVKLDLFAQPQNSATYVYIDLKTAEYKSNLCLSESFGFLPISQYMYIRHVHIHLFSPYSHIKRAI